MNALKLRYGVHRALDARDCGKGLDKLVDTFLVILVLMNAAVVVLGTVNSLNEKYGTLFYVIELVSVYFFTVEYVLRLWSCIEDPRYRGMFGRLKYTLTPMALIDLASILPYFLTFGLLDMRIFRVVRLLRLLKIARYIPALVIVETVVMRKRNELLVSLGVIALMLVLVSSLMFVVENDAQPEKFSSIPETMWWGVATLTTVGYGDVFPVTTLGKMFSSIIAVLGLGLFALPTGILASGFSDEINRKREENEPCAHKFCPNCGHNQAQK